MPQRPLNEEPEVQPLGPSLGSVNSSKSGLWGKFAFPKFANRKKNDGSAPGQTEQLQDEKRVTDELVAPRTLAERRGVGVKGVVAGLPRALTLRRIDSEKRDRLLPNEERVLERRSRGGPTRRRAYSAMRPIKSRSPEAPFPRRSAPEQATYVESLSSVLNQDGPKQHHRLGLTISTSTDRKPGEANDDLTSPPPPLSPDDGVSDREEVLSPDLNDPEFQKEIESTWILNLTMRFRDGSNREKFIITYAQRPTLWRRVTVSCDYRNAERDSLEANLKDLVYHRDKNAQIYDAIRESLPDIQYFPTVTNLKLETKDHRLHVHVTEDINEKIDYPNVTQIEHLALRPSERLRESAIRFEAHLSGFVYKVSVNGRTYIKKEIPSPDTVEEFLYEIDALYRLRGSEHVIKFRGVVLDEKEELIKGLLIDYAPKGSLADLIYDDPEYPLEWSRREKWTRQIVQGLADIHEHGFVQGDFTLSNIVIDGDDNAKIIDINRRGCPVGWEPPEFMQLIESGRRISMFIGVKSDIFQMGMCLWGLAELCDEPDREEAELEFKAESDTPPWLQSVINICLHHNPSRRRSAKDLLALFPTQQCRYSGTTENSRSQPASQPATDTATFCEDDPNQGGRLSWSTQSQAVDSLPGAEVLDAHQTNDTYLPSPPATRGPVHANTTVAPKTTPANIKLQFCALADKQLGNTQGEQTPLSFNPPLHQDSGFQDSPGGHNLDIDLGAPPPPIERASEPESSIVNQRGGSTTDDLAGIGSGWTRNTS